MPLLKQRLDAVYKLRHEHKIKTLCRVLKVNRSSYYKHFYSPISKRELENQKLRTKILALYTASDKRLGVKKIKKRLEVEYGINISVGRVYRLIKSMKLPEMSTKKTSLRSYRKNNRNSGSNVLNRQI